MVVNKVHRGLAACSALEEFSLTATVPPRNISNISECQEEWLRTVEILALLPVRHLRRLRLDVVFSTSVANLVHLLSWSSLHAMCRELVNLSSLEVMILNNNPEGSAEHEDASPCIRFETQDFKAVVVHSRERRRVWECIDPGCLSYNASGRSNDEQRSV